ncbi:thiamine pyrophosphate-dependent enzyme [Lawsonibacter faecis]|uniref:2-oxoglutarate oxidoreductase n=1 Tax=Lawsonibacter faecis TaxID=2763052 RepID=A0A8J6MC21_9FIRM|nr:MULTISPECIES: thiamine pyrophosphate-dependent enzyme [Oscillospiraceae]MTQ98269.1 2-oxoglutarate oxidoreductase [Pseudoflavonifractor sp. BIOML-A16]MTR07950.1 2-oxoglutarate oxidoreductase [Pseudoflavonifractor sp. BIOML-A15]MTR33974.1 2-oxoglutarate oxidoreductase [Pseudoflavonifractor sp. BIOML-A14]MTR74960.1 2-oxoglutarate oxidoreductase [Pseudoflavonifractor sp. BIOML-A18]MTS65748.1 2-oxoglutarate oxidoreductase [Pseudoflavonifractor sp. BIOML-A5]MTS73078.1 2-oxoglutarate oxidoreducta
MLKTIPKACFIDNKYCPGCGHGIANRLVAEVLEEMGRDGDALAAIAVGCASLMPDTFGIDCVQAQHGRAAAVAVGMKRCRPDKLVFTYQGDGDALAIGFSETMYAAVRHENITVIFVNNGNFGMTGGQMAPTTLEGQRTTTSPRGRDVRTTGDPMNIMELLKPLDPAYLARGSMTSNAEILKTKKYIRTAFEAQERGVGYSFVEILSPCPTNWGLSAMDAVARIRAEVVPVYPLGEFVKKEGL